VKRIRHLHVLQSEECTELTLRHDTVCKCSCCAALALTTNRYRNGVHWQISSYRK